MGNDFMMLSPRSGLSSQLWKDKINLNGSVSYNISGNVAKNGWWFLCSVDCTEWYYFLRKPNT